MRSTVETLSQRYVCIFHSVSSSSVYLCIRPWKTFWSIALYVWINPLPYSIFVWLCLSGEKNKRAWKWMELFRTHIPQRQKVKQSVERWRQSMKVEKKQKMIFVIIHISFHSCISTRTQEFVESSLQTINEIATEKLGAKCASKAFHTLQVPLNTARYEGTRQKADLASVILQDVGLNHHGGKWKRRRCWWYYETRATPAVSSSMIFSHPTHTHTNDILSFYI